MVIADVDPLLLYKPYSLEVGMGGDKVYVLLRDTLVKLGKIAIRLRQHLAEITPEKCGLA